jgi:hypothetical protein
MAVDMAGSNQHVRISSCDGASVDWNEPAGSVIENEALAPEPINGCIPMSDGVGAFFPPIYNVARMPAFGRAVHQMDFRFLVEGVHPTGKADWPTGRMKPPDLDHDEFIPLPVDTLPAPNSFS